MDVGKTIAWTVGMPLAEARSSSASRTSPTGYPLSIMAVPRAAIESSTTGLGTVSVVTVAVPISGAGAGRRRISHQMNSPAASSTPTAMSRVGRVVVDVAIAGGTAGTGVAVDASAWARVRVRVWVWESASAKERGSRTLWVWGREWSSTSGWVSRLPYRSAWGWGSPTRQTGRGPSSLSVQPLAEPGRAAARSLPPPRGRTGSDRRPLPRRRSNRAGGGAPSLRACVLALSYCNYSTIAISWGVRLSRRPPSAVTVTMSSMRTPNRPGR